MKISEYEIVDHGIDSSSYFQGCGTSFTQFENVVTGIGEDPAEALDDCIEQIASSHDVDTSTIDLDYFDAMYVELNTVDHSDHVNDETEEVYDECDIHYFVSVRYNLGE